MIHSKATFEYDPPTDEQWERIEYEVEAARRLRDMGRCPECGQAVDADD